MASSCKLGPRLARVAVKTLVELFDRQLLERESRLLEMAWVQMMSRCAKQAVPHQYLHADELKKLCVGHRCPLLAAV